MFPRKLDTGKSSGFLPPVALRRFSVQIGEHNPVIVAINTHPALFMGGYDRIDGEATVNAGNAGSAHLTRVAYRDARSAIKEAYDAAENACFTQEIAHITLTGARQGEFLPFVAKTETKHGVAYRGGYGSKVNAHGVCPYVFAKAEHAPEQIHFCEASSRDQQARDDLAQQRAHFDAQMILSQRISSELAHAKTAHVDRTLPTGIEICAEPHGAFHPVLKTVHKSTGPIFYGGVAQEHVVNASGSDGILLALNAIPHQPDYANCVPSKKASENALAMMILSSIHSARAAAKEEAIASANAALMHQQGIHSRPS